MYSTGCGWGQVPCFGFGVMLEMRDVTDLRGCEVLWIRCFVGYSLLNANGLRASVALRIRRLAGRQALRIRRLWVRAAKLLALPYSFE